MAIFPCAQSQRHGDHDDPPKADRALLRGDEARTHRGLAAIKQWKTETRRKYSYTIEPLAAEQHGEITAVKGKVSGNFPGSPVLIEFCFRLSGDKIASLEIRG
jgi:hypothetical protein